MYNHITYTNYFTYDIIKYVHVENNSTIFNEFDENSKRKLLIVWSILDRSELFSVEVSFPNVKKQG